ncbi:30228_t:CDS:1 [Racocetra persica]|nr:30228_t:CDS:1 [Racocetra persica]
MSHPGGATNLIISLSGVLKAISFKYPRAKWSSTLHEVLMSFYASFFQPDKQCVLDNLSIHIYDFLCTKDYPGVSTIHKIASSTSTLVRNAPLGLQHTFWFCLLDFFQRLILIASQNDDKTLIYSYVAAVSSFEHSQADSIRFKALEILIILLNNYPTFRDRVESFIDRKKKEPEFKQFFNEICKKVQLDNELITQTKLSVNENIVSDPYYTNI